MGVCAAGDQVLENHIALGAQDIQGGWRVQRLYTVLRLRNFKRLHDTQSL